MAIAIQQATAYQQLETELAERQKTEAHLRQSEQRYASLAAAVPVGIFRTDAQGNCFYVNERWCSLTGLTPEEAAETGWIKSGVIAPFERVQREKIVIAMSGESVHAP
nr:PAS domain S-box protein [Nostoc sp. UIC 10630]